MEATAGPARYAVRTLFALALFGAVVAWLAGPAHAGPLARAVVPTTVEPAPGTMQVDLGEVAASGTVTLTLTVPDGWTTPTTSAPGTVGYTDTTAQCGAGSCAPIVSNMTITSAA